MSPPDTIDQKWVYVKMLEVYACQTDDEKAHALEDELHQAVLKAIADGTCEDPRMCAAQALKTLEIPFARWCA